MICTVICRFFLKVINHPASQMKIDGPDLLLRKEVFCPTPHRNNESVSSC